jgi:DNA polymerase I-like protein with 3'-5' exonuclease and polymerase domains
MLADNLSEAEAIALLESLMHNIPELEVNVREDLYTKLARVLMAAYKIKFPAAKRLADLASRTAQTRGFIKTLMGRRARFNTWVPAKWSPDGQLKPLPLPDALANYGANISRSHTHKALNSLLQGSAADVMKQTMVAIMESGTLDVLGAPLLTVHDELVLSVPRTKEGLEALRETARMMCETVTLRVPLAVDTEVGPSWGEVETIDWENFV